MHAPPGPTVTARTAVPILTGAVLTRGLPFPVGEDPFPTVNRNGLPQAGRPERVAFHQIPDIFLVATVDGPETADRKARPGVAHGAGGFDSVGIPFQEAQMRLHMDIPLVCGGPFVFEKYDEHDAIPSFRSFRQRQ